MLKIAKLGLIHANRLHICPRNKSINPVYIYLNQRCQQYHSRDGDAVCLPDSILEEMLFCCMYLKKVYIIIYYKIIQL